MSYVKKMADNLKTVKCPEEFRKFLVNSTDTGRNEFKMKNCPVKLKDVPKCIAEVLDIYQYVGPIQYDLSGTPDGDGTKDLVITFKEGPRPPAEKYYPEEADITKPAPGEDGGQGPHGKWW